MIEKNTSGKKKDLWAETLAKSTVEASRFLCWSIQELYFSFRFKTIPLTVIVPFSIIISALLSFRIDYRFFIFLKISWLYPFNPTLYWPYAITLTVLPYFVWGAKRYLSLKRLLKFLTLNFREAGLITNMGRLPIFLSDRPFDEGVREIRFHMNGVPFSSFLQAKEALGSCFGFVEDIRNQEDGTVGIQYSRTPLRSDTVIKDIPAVDGRASFAVGYSRSGLVTANLTDVPHLLIAGATNSGKSTFVRQLIATLITKNRNTTVYFIDLKHSLEASAFYKSTHVNAVTTVTNAIATFLTVEAQIKERAGFLLHNGCDKIEQLLEKAHGDIKWTEHFPNLDSLGRQVIIVDEATELFLAGGQADAKQSQQATRSAISIAATGRATGVHLIIATQRPDKNAVDMKIKTNLVGRLCFSMSDNHSSMTVLDNARAAQLPNKPGRAIWKVGGTMKEVNTLCLSKTDLENILSGKAAEQNAKPITTESLPVSVECVPSDSSAIKRQAVER